MQRTVTIRVEWKEEDSAWLATSDDLVGLIIQEETLEDCCRISREVAQDMLAQYQEGESVPLLIDFIIEKERSGS
ncbi:MAG: DUF1902 domain-containing protein [Alphaproteobacteria bacterium]|nr:DUF1902 domain-containing protein [Alphaproteobacteria bacterium]